MPLSNSVAILFIGLLCLTTGTFAQVQSELTTEVVTLPNNLNEILARSPDYGLTIVDEAKKQEIINKYANRNFQVSVDSIEPEGGPITGNTRVLVRGGPFTDLQILFPKPKCKFGKYDMVVQATYVLCTTWPTQTEELEPRHRHKNDTCLQCDNSPDTNVAEIVPFTVSLIGDFSDSANSMPYRYYQRTRVWAIYPRYGPKDGFTFVQVWGENFLNFDENTRCNFGSKSVIAHFVSNNYMTCIAPFSDVVEKPIPFSVSLNKQQNSKDSIDYWYYNWPQVVELVPNYGPDSGGNKVLVKGNNFDPFVAESINNTNDTFCEFEGIGKVQGYPINSTKMICIAPANYVLDKTYVEVTLNNQQYTDDNVPYFYYKPPQVFDIDPREGPTKGGTKVYIYGDKFQDSKKLKCNFGGKIVPATYISTNKMLCTSPPYERPGYVYLTVSNDGERYSAETVQYLYYESPEIYNMTPTCGPVTGYTQITVFGKNFINMGFGKAKCIFNMTHVMNATIMTNDTLKCDSPPLPPSQGFSDGRAPWYNVSVTMNGRDIAQSKLKFIYYIDPTIKSITPNVGSICGGTISRIKGKGFNQEGVCNVTVRYGAYQQHLHKDNFSDTDINATSPPAEVPGSVVVSVALNGQQFINDKTLHFRDEENTFTYYQDVFIQEYTPKKGPATGKTKMRVMGMGFKQFNSEYSQSNKSQPIWVRFRKYDTGELIQEATQAFDIEDEEFKWLTPPADAGTKAILEISYNQQEWRQILDEGKNYSYTYYNGPKITSINPNYGPVKSPDNLTTDIIGKNFICPENNCSNLYVRFGDPENGTWVKGERISDEKIRVVVPKYPKPDVLPVEITLDGEEFTNDNQTYGYFDPYILDLKPRLINKKGNTRVRLYGFGFVNASNELKTMLHHVIRKNLTCQRGNCSQPAEYINKTVIESPTFPQKDVTFKDNGENINLEGMAMEASVIGDVYTENDLEIWYYDEPEYLSTSLAGAPQNSPSPIYTNTNFKWGPNDIDKFRKYGNLTCRFTSHDGKRVAYTKARMEIYPLGSATSEDDLPTHMKCDSPKWNQSEQVKMALSVNGQDFSGCFPFNFYDPLDLYRIAPMAGPLEGNTRVKLFGSGFDSKEDTYLKWGVIETEKHIKSEVMEYIWNETDFIANTMVPGSEVLSAYKKEAPNVEKRDYELNETQRLTTYVAHSPKLVNWNRTHGGPVYLSVGQNLKINTTNLSIAEDENGNIVNVKEPTFYTDYLYSFSFVEYYYYHQPVVKKVVPRSGLTSGGTRIEISGAWFDYKPEYGIIPHCKIGDKVVRAQFYTTVRIVCNSPPNEDVTVAHPILVSLNGVDFVDTGYKYRYYEQPILYNMTPTAGPESGGTEIYITGSKFSNISDPQTFNCKFTPYDMNVPPKFIPAIYINKTTIMCTSPGGWGQGGSVHVQVTFNGEEYSDNNFTFNYYNIIRAFPRSGPSDGSGEPIRIEGNGFRNGSEIYCSLDKTLYEPVEVRNDLILCPMAKAKGGDDFFGNVDLAVVIDGNWHKFTGGFQYYGQILLDDMSPHVGPSEGQGIVYFYGRGFRDDFVLADVGCKIGDAIGKGKVVDPTTIKCVVEEMSLVDEGYSLPASVALNSYSWAESNQTFIPYGITAVYPNSGPYTGNTDVLIVGKGFQEDLAEKARCRFGIPANFAIVEAEVLSYDKMICRSPPDFKLPSTSDQTLSVPIGIAFLEDEYDPWTESVHRFRFYQNPRLVLADPDEIEVGDMDEILVFADDSSEFWEPIPTGKGSLGQYGIECKFGRFGIGMGEYVNKTTIKCMTPSVSDDPSSVSRETIIITAALNGQDFDEDSSDAEFTFIGTGSALAFWPWILGCLLIGLLLIALIVFCSAIFQKVSFEKVVAIKQNERKQKSRPYVIRDPYDQFTSRAYSAGMMGRMSPH